MRSTRCLAVAAGLGCALSASAQVANLDVDESQSTAEVQVSLPQFSLSDSDTSSIDGTIDIELDDYGVPMSISIVDFAVATTSPINLSFSLGILGSGSASISTVNAAYASDFPTAPVAIGAGGAFSIEGVPLTLEGSGALSGSGLFSALDGTALNLADFGVVPSTLMGTVQVVGEQVQISVQVEGSGEQEINMITVVGGATLTLVASGDVPEPVACPGDLADSSGFGPADGMVDFGDFFALSFLAGPCGGGTSNPGCDGDLADSGGFGAPDGMIDFGDFFALSFLAGPCP